MNVHPPHPARANTAPLKVAVASLLGASAGPLTYERLGAWWSAAAIVALFMGAATLLWGWQRRSATLVGAALGLVVFGVSLRALGPLDTLVPDRADGVVTLRSDPRRSFGGIEVMVTLGDRRLLASIDGPAAGEVASLQLGDSMRITGRTQLIARPTGWHRAQHLSGELVVDSVSDIATGRGPYALAAGVRERIRASVEPLSPDSQALVLGAALGDDRTQTDAQRDRFLRSGLTHLLVVSGQNVALMLVLCGPLLHRVPTRHRWLAVALTVGWFVLVVRPDPSVLRAGAAALVVAVASRSGQLLDAPSVLAGALTAVVIVDPLVIGSLGFWLSAAATLGLVVGLGSRRGSEWDPAAVARATLAAQVGVAPVLAVAGLPVPVASLPANVLAGAPAGVLTLWGMTAGLFTGSLPGWLAWVVRAPVAMAAWWVDRVARVASQLPLGRLTPTETMVLGGLALLSWAAWRLGGGWSVRTQRAVLAPLVVATCWAIRPMAPQSGPVPGGCLIVNAAGTTLVLERAPPSVRRLLDTLAEAEVRQVDVLVIAPGGLRVAEAGVAVIDAVRVAAVARNRVVPTCR